MIMKYTLNAIKGITILQIPKWHETLSIQVLGNTPVVYIDGEHPTKDLIDIEVTSFYTGDTSAGDYLGTAVLDEGAYVLHYYV